MVSCCQAAGHKKLPAGTRGHDWSGGDVTDEMAISEARGLTRSFGGCVAVNGVDLKVREGTIHALIGPNGAGKSTLFNLLTKFLQPSQGRIFFKGRDITGMKP